MRIARNPAAALALIAFCLGACTVGREVIQGRVEEYDRSGERLVLTDERDPARVLELSTKNAEIGAEPVLGDTVRVAYVESNGKLVATRIMNVTRQEEVGRKVRQGGSGGH